MANDLQRFSIRILALILGAAICATITQAQSLQTINPPQGGKIVYGQVTGQTTEAGAMGAVLGSLHRSLGDRPQVGKLFQVHGTESVATFFTVNRKDQGPGQPVRPIAGLLIVTKVTSDHVEAALVSDDAAHLSKTLKPMLKTLFAAWHPFQGAQSSGSVSGASAPAAQLHPVTLQDNSASISLPDGWKLASNFSGGGTIVASGPNGETAEMDIPFLAQDTNNPAVQRTMQTLRNGGLRNTAYATAVYLPYGADLQKTFLYMMRHLRQQARLPEASYNFAHVTAMPATGQEHCVHMEGTADMNDGKGQREMNAVYCVRPPGPMGAWGSSAYMTMIPVQIAAKERATLGAVMASFRMNTAVVQSEANAYAQPEIDKIHAIGRASAQAAKDAHQLEDIHNSSVYQHWDSMDRRSQEFSNYQLDNAVIATTDNSAHGTFTQDEASFLVQQNPDKFEFVSAPNYWKGIDY